MRAIIAASARKEITHEQVQIVLPSVRDVQTDLTDKHAQQKQPELLYAQPEQLYALRLEQ